MHQPPSSGSRWRNAAIVTCTIAVLSGAALAAHRSASPVVPAPQTANTLDRIRDAMQVRLGYRADARPFSFKDDAGRPAGYSVTLCDAVAKAIKAERGLDALTTEWIPVTADDRFRALQEGRVDMLCAAETVTLARREHVSFSLPVFLGGVGALVRTDAPANLRDVLAGRNVTFHPTWRAASARALHARAFTVIQGTTADDWVTSRLAELKVVADVSRVAAYDAGVQALLERRSDVFFGERAVLLDTARHHSAARDLVPIDRLFTYEPLALAIPRGDEEFRLLVDRVLSRLFRSGEMVGLYTTLFGEPDESALTFFRWTALPE
jgi:ABC-type amino acid transport substrate-binding protein